MSGRARMIGAACGVALLSVFIIAARPRFSRDAVQLFADDCPCGDYHEDVTGLIALNPLRSRAPEQLATHFLSDLSQGKCETTIDPSICQYGLTEARPLLDWKLRNRHDSGNKVSLFYMVEGKHRPGRDIYPHDAWGEGMVEVERSGTQWRVSNYGVYY
jgi:hypothetical protein